MYTVNDLFSNASPTSRKAYDRLINSLETLGPVIVEPKKTSIHLVNKTGFAGVHPRKNYFYLEIKSDREISHPRIDKSEKVSANRYHLRVKMESGDQVDEELLGWLKTAYELSR